MRRAALASALAVLLAGGCDDMRHQDKKGAYADAQVAPGPRPDGAVGYRTRPVAPPPVTEALLQRGQERFRIYCTPCHSELGDGRGMIVQRGFPAPPSYHSDRLRNAPPQHFYDVITNGYGTMYSFAARVQPVDRWAITAYIRALQRSQDAGLADLTPEQRAALP
jgi:mono/diheme cytochrome c family protein